MLYIVCALAWEAQPLIEAFKLKFRPALFPLYENESCQLIISGMGKTKAAAAVSYLFAQGGQLKDAVWLNIGTAGHVKHAVGTAFLAHKVSESTSSQAFYPYIPVQHSWQTAELHTVDHPEKSYTRDVLYDMEGFGFYEITTKVSTIEKIHCLKIVSDNLADGFVHFSKNRVYELIHAHVPALQSFVEEMHKLNPLHGKIEEQEKLFWAHCHYTASQKAQLKRLLVRFYACWPQGPAWLEEYATLKKAQDIFLKLEKRINASPLKF